jgi:hypothetical protein
MEVWDRHISRFLILLEHFSTQKQGRQSTMFSLAWITVHSVLIHSLVKRTSRQRTRAKLYIQTIGTLKALFSRLETFGEMAVNEALREGGSRNSLRKD